MRRLIVALTSIIFVGCMPVLVREHERIGATKDRCGHGARARPLEHAGLKLASYDVQPEKSKLVFKASFWGVEGHRIRVDDDALTVRWHAGKTVSVPLTIKAFRMTRISKERHDVPANFKRAIAFSPDVDFPENFVTLEGSFPFEDKDFELTEPRITIDDEVIPPSILRYHYRKGVRLDPINGC